jgi:hypothetical protein
VAGVSDVPSAEELSALPAVELAARLAEAYRLIGELTAQNERLADRVGQLERNAGKDSSTSSRPTSSDRPYKKKGADRSLRERGKRRPGKQPGDPGTTMKLIDDPDERIWCPPPVCCGCGTGLAGEAVTAQRRHQVTDISPAPAPRVTEYVAQAKECPGCGTVTEGELPCACAGTGQLRAGGLRAGRESDSRPLHPGLPGDAAAVPARRHRRLDGVDGRDPGPRCRAGGGQRVYGQDPGTAENGPGGPRG